ncbi:MAG: hypothetical protein L0387_35880 [Acidobacteria bacterium]|nr:hypothetical protein [Acidobacteriota bacterium]MCI0626971.1 hypothetical protein [Acidobacteriota bacterium]MCI0717837.1 hypothetical protein [Acidobacteriota bacterium]
MPRDWKLIAKGLAPEIPEPELEKVRANLQGLEGEFASLIQTLPHDIEPAIILPSFEEHS